MKSRLAAFLLAALTLSACNLFDPLDSPTSDAQLISVARACFNKGDIECAREKYGQLSASSADIKNSETAFLTVDALGAGMGAFIQAFGQDGLDGNTGTGKALTSISNSIGSRASRANRVAIYNAFKTATLVQDQRLKGLSQFVTALALAAEMLAETAAIPGHLAKADLVNPAAGSVATCEAADSTTCVAAAACTGATTPLDLTGQTIPGTGRLDAITDDTFVDQASLSLEVFNAAVATINQSLSDMGLASTDANVGGFSTSLTGVTQAVAAQYNQCYHNQLLSLGIGT